MTGTITADALADPHVAHLAECRCYRCGGWLGIREYEAVLMRMDDHAPHMVALKHARCPRKGRAR